MEFSERKVQPKRRLKRLLLVLFFVVVTIAIVLGIFLWRIQYPGIPRVDSDTEHIACVGDSITYGAGVIGRRATSTYPAYLQELFGDEYQVLNYGLSGRTLQSTADMPYINEKHYTESLKCHADIYIIMLGTNDSKPYNWDPENFSAELEHFLKPYITIAGAENVYLMKPPRAFVLEGKTEEGHHIRNENILAEQGIIAEVAEKSGVKVIDLYTLTENHPEWFDDGIHPNAEGNKAIAETIYQKIFSVE